MTGAFEVFTTKADDLYNKIKKEVDYNVSTIREISMSPEDIEHKSKEVFDMYFKFPKLTFGEETKSKRTDEMSIDKASQLIGNGFSFSLSSNTTPITTLTYMVSYTGGKEAIATTIQNGKRAFWGALEPSILRLDYYFQGSDLDTFGPQFKQVKESVLELLSQNNIEVQQFFESKRAPLLDYIKDSIDQKVKENKKDIDDLDKF